MNDAANFMIAGMINRLYWRGRLLGAENLPAAGPAVFVAEDEAVAIIAWIPEFHSQRVFTAPFTKIGGLVVPVLEKMLN